MTKLFLFLFSLMSLSTCFGSLPLSKLSTEEKVGQLLIAHFHGKTANKESCTLIQQAKIGGIIYYNWANGLTSPEQVQTLSSGLQQQAKGNPLAIPLFIAVDQEGGRIARLTQGFTQFPSNQALGKTQDPRLAESNAIVMGKEMRAVGVNMNFAPVVDINNNPKNPVIGNRSFGDTAELVTAYGERALAGYHKAGIITTLKHFPGHGDVEIDSHEDLPVIHKSMEQLEKLELIPFAKLSAQTDAIMTAHLLVPALDPEYCSTLSLKTLSYLRETIGFQGVIISDSLMMKGVLKKCHSVDEAAIQAFNAGCDLLILGGKQLIGANLNAELDVEDVLQIHQSLVNAVKSGRIQEERLNQSIERILKLKERYLHNCL